ncbi:galactose operon repressor, GalR-LacI family of transcriptional regulators [Lachnospiraceae bacterium KM106-2]|nr:galactose operon repressor, GalR-LacI family of transcriptional regulators [Lachnospiraceae bacterium KM106-2]
MVTIKQIAEAVGVSSATVSRVLNYDETISVNEDTRAAIFKVADQLGYKKRKINPTIENVAFLYWVDEKDDLEDVYFNSIRKELEKQAKKRNIKMELYKKEDGIKKVPSHISAFLAIGWFDRKELEYLYSLTSNGIFINSSPDEKHFDSVRPNLDSVVTQIVDYFVESGHKSIGFIGGKDRNIDTCQEAMDVREWSFRESAKYYGLLNEDYLFTTDNYSVEEGYKISKQMITLLGDKVPTAFCVASDTLAIGALQAFNECGWEIPKRVAFFSINDVKVAQYVSPPLTTFHIDVPLICESALDLLQERILKGRSITKTVYINGTPIFRKSC